MKRKPVSELTMDELGKQKNLLNGIIIGAGLLLLFLTGVILYQIILEQQYYMSLLLISCVLSIIPGFIGLQEIDKEMKNRITEDK
nr:hypothetical protein [Pedobacter panaciterrae]